MRDWHHVELEALLNVRVPMSLNVFLKGIIDYAGLFPPAKLPLDEAIRNYARYRREPDEWMLARFICPASRLTELLEFPQEIFAPGARLSVSTLGRGGRTASEFMAGFELDLADIAAFHSVVKARGHEREVRVEVLEVKAPVDGFGDRPGDGSTSIGRCAEALCARGVPFLFLESGAAIERLPAAIEQLNREVSAAAGGFAPGQLGLKLRCGGTEAAAIPSTSMLAAILARRNTTLKCTAGLHHPFRHQDATLGAHMHGFINVFAAGMLAEIHAMSPEQVQAVLEDHDAAHFSFRDDGFRWRDWSITTEQIINLRQTRMTSFGSCSFDEPREDLKRLGWI